jgi:hypothetical protein
MSAWKSTVWTIFVAFTSAIWTEFQRLPTAVPSGINS